MSRKQLSYFNKIPKYKDIKPHKIIIQEINNKLSLAEAITLQGQ